MKKIMLLDKHTAELIAAGEVVERPSSVVKELMENSIDAGAKSITVEIKHGGNTYLRITDDGFGIASEDVKTAFLRHATSKIKTETDLDAIVTLGFRGEALASIAAVSKVEFITRTSDSELGTKYEIDGGEEKGFDECGTAVGTTIIVRDLFFNTPARQKFLKKDVSEGNAITAIVDRVSLSHPEIAFRLIRDDKETLSTPGDNQLLSCIYAVLGKEFSESLIPVKYSMNGIDVSGFVSKPFMARSNRNMQFFYISGRYVKTKTAMAALEEAYKNSIMSGRFPGCILNIKISPEQVDVNVHPAKIEVRFSDEKALFRAVFYAVKSAITNEYSAPALETISQPISQPINKIDSHVMSNQLEIEKQQSTILIDRLSVDTNEKNVTNYFSLNENNVFGYSNKAIKPNVNIDLFPEIEEETMQKTEEKILKKIKYIGEAFDTYIIVEVNENIIFIDKHAAHERILFEEIRSNIKNESQMLITPVSVMLSAEEYDAFINNINQINDTGFETEDYGNKTILIRGLPMSLDKEDVKELIFEIADKLLKEKDFTPEFLDWLYHSVACRAAIKAGNHSTDAELINLAQRVIKNDDIRYCPHGRPTAIELTINEIKKRFGRI